MEKHSIVDGILAKPYEIITMERSVVIEEKSEISMIGVDRDVGAFLFDGFIVGGFA